MNHVPVVPGWLEAAMWLTLVLSWVFAIGVVAGELEPSPQLPAEDYTKEHA